MAWVEPNVTREAITGVGAIGSRRGQYELRSGVMPVEQRGPTGCMLMQDEERTAWVT